MSSIQAYKAHKQEGTLVSKVHKQGALDRHIKHQWLHCMSNNQAIFSIFCNLELHLQFLELTTSFFNFL